MRRRRILVQAVAAAAVLGVLALTLAAMGRSWWCRAGDGGLWAGDVWSRHNSQHLVDPYTFTHVLHGLVFYAAVWAMLRRRATPAGRAWVAFLLEAGWEIVENTDAVIERYRAATISLDYFGDSVANSLGDVLAFVVGYAAAGVMPVWVSAAAFCFVDGALLFWIRDSLLLNVVMLLHPIDAIRRWQARGG